MDQTELSDADVGLAPANNAIFAPGAPAGASPTQAQQNFAQVSGNPQGVVYDYAGSQAAPGQAHVTPSGQMIDPQGVTMNPSAQGEMTDQDVFGAAAPPLPPAKSNEWLGAQVGFMKPIDNIANWAEQGLSAIGIPIASWDHALGMPSAADTKAAHIQYLAQQAQRGVVPGKIGQFIGGMPLQAAIDGTGAGPLLGGALYGAANSDATDPAGIAKDAGISALLSKSGDLALGGLSKLLAPKVRAPAQLLLNEGVPLTGGQIAGGTAQRIEDGLTSLPIGGDMIKARQGEALQAFNTAAINRSLSPIGNAVPAGITGRDAIDYASNALGQGYEQLLPQMGLQADPQFLSDMKGVMSDAQQNLTPEAYDQVGRILYGRSAPRFDQSGAMAGDAYKDLDSQLGQLSRRYGSSPDGNSQAMGDVFGAAKDAFRGALERSNPQDIVDRLKALDTGYAALTRVQQAAASPAAVGGVFTPAQLQMAVRAGDSSVRKTAFAKGDALMQDLADAGREVLPSTVPDSGSPLRHILEAAVTFGVGKEAKFPFATAAVPGTSAVGAFYSKPAQDILRTVMSAPRPAPALTHRAGSFLDALRPLGSALGAFWPQLQAQPNTELPP